MPTPTDSPRECPLPLSFYERRYGLSRTTLWRWRRAGLKAVGVGEKVFIKESDFLDFVERMGGRHPVCEAQEEVAQ